MIEPTEGAATAPGDGQGAATTPEEGGTASWLDSLSETETFTIKGEDGAEKAIPLREHPKLKEFKSPEELAKSLLNQEKLLGKKVIGLAPLKPDATDEEKAAWDKEFRTVMGVPEKPEDYKLPIPEGMPIHKEFKNWFLKSAHENGMSPAQVERQVSSYAAWAAGMMKANEEAALKEAEEAKRATAAEATKLFGGETQATEAVELARRGFSAVCARARIEPEKAEAIAKTLGDDLTMVRLFHYIGKNTSLEDSNVDGSPGSATQSTSTEDFYAKEVFGGK
jgi:hypothetical protein